MKPVILIFSSILLFSFHPSLTADKNAEIYGTWVGGFGTEKKVSDAVMKLLPGNRVEFYRGEMDEAAKCQGIYQVKGDSLLIITLVEHDQSLSLQLFGRFNKTKNFVDGYWKSKPEGSGSFYLQKL